MKVKYGSDCSGIEAPYIALVNLLGVKNVEHIFASDNDKNVLKMIETNFPPKILNEDVFDIKMDKRPYVDIYVAGFPCQSFSTNGKNGGFHDDRGIVFFTLFEYIRHVKPRVCVFENVSGLVTRHKKEFQHILNKLEGLKIYNVYHKVISPDECGWPQHRPRVFIVCLQKNYQKRSFKFPVDEPLKIKASDLLDSHEYVPNTPLTDFNLKNLNEHNKNIQEKYGISITDDYFITDIRASPAFGRPMYEKFPTLKKTRSNYYIPILNRFMTIEETEKAQGFPPLDIVISDSEYLSQLGNSMCIPLLEKIFKEIFAVMNFDPEMESRKHLHHRIDSKN